MITKEIKLIMDALHLLKFKIKQEVKVNETGSGALIIIIIITLLIIIGSHSTHADNKGTPTDKDGHSNGPGSITPKEAINGYLQSLSFTLCLPLTIHRATEDTGRRFLSRTH